MPRFPSPTSILEDGARRLRDILEVLKSGDVSLLSAPVCVGDTDWDEFFDGLPEKDRFSTSRDAAFEEAIGGELKTRYSVRVLGIAAGHTGLECFAGVRTARERKLVIYRGAADQSPETMTLFLAHLLNGSEL